MAEATQDNVPRTGHWTGALMHEMARLLPTNPAGDACRQQVDYFLRLPPNRQEERLVELVLNLEDAIIAHLTPRPTRDALRRRLMSRFGEYLGGARFIPIDVSSRQRVRLRILFLTRVIDRVVTEEGASLAMLLQVKNWAEGAPDRATLPVPYTSVDKLPENDTGWLNLLDLLCQRVCEFLRDKIGLERTQDRMIETLGKVSADFGTLDAYRSVVDMLPEWALAGRRLREITRDLIERVR